MGYNFLGVLEIIKDAIKILPKNGKIMASIAAMSFLVYSSIFSFAYFFIFKTLSSSKDAKTQVSVFILFVLCLIISSIFSRIINLSTIYVSAMSVNGQQVSFKELYLRVKRSFKGGSIFSNPRSRNKSRWLIALVILITVLMIDLLIIYGFPLVFAISALVVILVPTMVYSIYISVTSLLAYIIYTVEENCGKDEAATKAEMWLVKERKIDGFVLYFSYILFIFGLVLVYGSFITMKRPSAVFIAGIVFLCVASLHIMFFFVEYTYLYFKCKEEHSSDAARLPLLDENVP